MKIGLGIPTLNRYDLLNIPLRKYVSDFDVYLVDNGNQNIQQDNCKIFVQEKNIGVAASWNILCREIFKKHDWAGIS